MPTRARKKSEDRRVNMRRRRDATTTTNVHHLGTMDVTCSGCDALHFTAEHDTTNSVVFKNCCHKAKVKLHPISSSIFLQELIQKDDQTSKEYLKNIRKYNAAHQMVSMQAELEENPGHGVYYYKIHGQVYHSIGPLLTNDSHPARNASVYTYDVDEAVQQRMSNTYNAECDANLMKHISNYIHQVNPYAQQFKTMHNLWLEEQSLAESENRNTREVCMYLHGSCSPDGHPGRYNDASGTEKIATIFKSSDGAPPLNNNRDIVIYLLTGGIRQVPILSNIIDPLTYPLLFPNGDKGWDMNMEHIQENRTVSRFKVTLLQYVSYRLSVRPGFSLLHRSQKLFLQYIVDIYVRIESQRLTYIRMNQSKLRADLYCNVMDFMIRESNELGVVPGKMVILPSSFIGSPRNMHERYLDAMRIIQVCGKPSLFITFTANPNWDEIKTTIQPENRPENCERKDFRWSCGARLYN
ncbi:uncharacterized protein LOC116164014 [Photinus pyralis]|uniref:uncharacterized protein LOC116164014 n=1 Tax=Photinus pyralis TaxID=7054 RepID=UPI001266E6A0|nr:uncharacterized protein LOC116164014 [Photinus pyralis]